MKKLILLFAIISIAFGCSKDEDKDNGLQKIWIDGYQLSIFGGEKESAMVKFIFFPENKGKEYDTPNIKLESNEFYKYIELPEDNTYSMLLDENKIKLKDGTIVEGINNFTSSGKNNEASKEIEMPIGRYFVVAIYAYRATGKHYWNKYACTYYDVISRYNPITLSVVIPDDFTQYGCIPWINWADKEYEF